MNLINPSTRDVRNRAIVVGLRGQEALPRTLVGGKGRYLGLLARAGFPVPNGFVVTSHAFDAGTRHILDAATDLGDAERCIQRGTLPKAIRDAIAEAYVALGGLVAVRSSATDEDAAAHSFAGQQVTILGAQGVDAVLDAVQQVWASLFGRDALLYRSRQRLDAATPQMAVVVQRMVQADTAGVIFCRNPVTDDPNEMLINSAYGLGETVVGGQNADTFYLDRETGNVRAQLAAKTSRIVSRPTGPEVEPVEASMVDAPSLNATQLAELRDTADRVEDLLAGPQDIEFAYSSDGHLCLLQARPITTRRGRRSSTGHAAALFSNANVGEALPGVGTPFTWSLIYGFARRGFETAFGALGLDVPDDYKLVASFRGRVYLNISEFVTIASQIPLLDSDTLAGLAGVIDVDGLEGTFTTMSPLRFLQRLPVTIPRLAISQLTMPWVAAAWARRFHARRDAFFANPLSTRDRQSLLDALHEVDDVFNRTGEVMLASASNFLMTYVLTTNALLILGGPEAAAKQNVLFSGLTNVRSAEPGLELLDLAREVKSRPELVEIFDEMQAAPARDILGRLRSEGIARGFLTRLDGFLERWGHRAPREAEVATPRWREDPSFLIEVIRQHLNAPRLPTAEEVQREQASQRHEATQLIRQHFFTGVGALFRVLLKWAQQNARLREELRAYVVDTLSMYRHLTLEIGRRLVSRDSLCTVDDVFYLSYAELRAYLEGDQSLESRARSLVAFRRALFTAFVDSPDPPDTFVLVHDQGVPDASIEPLGDGEMLTGLPGSPGRVTGPARVIHELTGDAMRVHPGEILVAPFTDVGWTPLFLVVAGVVADRGGPLSHSCVVAREYGIPAVVGVSGATQRIRTGDIITVDGHSGQVFIGT